jgi:membrane fusion protein (multidrug efflux system)
MPLARVALLLLVLALAATGLWKLRDGGTAKAAYVPPVPSVSVAPVRLREIEEHIEALGTTASWESIEVRSTVTEFVAAIQFVDGQAVAKNDVLLTLVQREEAARLAEARAFLDEQVRELARIEGLVASNSVSRNQLDERRTLLEIARQRLAGAEAAVADRTIRAPFDGVLGLRSVSPGALVTPDTVITTLDDIATLRLDFPVPTTYLQNLRVGSTVSATTPALPGRRFTGEVTGIDSRVNPVDRSLRLRARIDNSALQLKPGMLLNVDLHHDRRQALVIPEQSIIHYQRDHFVLRLDTADGNRLERRRISTGLRVPGSVEVLTGLAEGDLVVTEGLTARPGQQVQVREQPLVGAGE